MELGAAKTTSVPKSVLHFFCWMHARLSSSLLYTHAGIILGIGENSVLTTYVMCYDNKMVKATPHLFYPFIDSALGS